MFHMIISFIFAVIQVAFNLIDVILNILTNFLNLIIIISTNIFQNTTDIRLSYKFMDKNSKDLLKSYFKYYFSNIYNLIKNKKSKGN